MVCEFIKEAMFTFDNHVQSFFLMSLKSGAFIHLVTH